LRLPFGIFPTTIFVFRQQVSRGDFRYSVDGGRMAREAMLEFFSESAENQAQVIGSIENGIDFVPWT
jgi:hypothetical protein